MKINILINKIKNTFKNERGYVGIGLIVILIFVIVVASVATDRTGGIITDVNEKQTQEMKKSFMQGESLDEDEG